MAKKEFTFYGKNVNEVKKMDLKEFSKLLPARKRRTINRGFTDAQKILLKKIRKGEKNLKTHCRDMIIVPDMIGVTVRVFSGKDFIPVTITEEMLGHTLGEFILTRKRVAHSAPGIGATRSSASLSVR
jgi:small subunit ribosomal protein S19